MYVKENKNPEKLLGGSSITTAPVQQKDIFVQMCTRMRDFVYPLTTRKLDNYDEWLDTFEKFIENPENRIIYSEISKLIYELARTDEDSPIDTLQGNMYLILSNAEKRLQESDTEEKSKKNLVLYKSVVKLDDHITLAVRQREELERAAQKQAEIAKVLLQEDITKTTRDLTSQLVGLVSLFTAISFVVFGGISALDSILKTYAKIMNNAYSVLPTIVVGIVWMFCSMNLLFAFMYFAFRMAGKEDPKTAAEKSVFQKYPAVFVMNYILLCALLIFGFATICEMTGLGTNIFAAVIDRKDGWFWYGWIGIIAVMIYLGAVLKCKLGLPEREKKIKKHTFNFNFK